MYLNRYYLVLPLLSGALACSEKSNPQPTVDAGVDAGVAISPADTRSRKARLKFKGPDRLANDLSQALQLPTSELCLELGTYDCAKQAHTIALGGVSAYRQGILEPLPVTGVTSPIATDRLTLAACSERARRDFENPGQALFFGDLSTGVVDSEKREAVVEALAKAIWARTADPHERQLLMAFRDEVDGPQAEQDWAALVCFMMTSSSEFLFY